MNWHNHDEKVFRAFQVTEDAYSDDDGWGGERVATDQFWLYEHLESGIVVSDPAKFEKWLGGVVKL